MYEQITANRKSASAAITFVVKQSQTLPQGPLPKSVSIHVPAYGEVVAVPEPKPCWILLRDTLAYHLTAATARLKF
jgi:hypothetical protein